MQESILWYDLETFGVNPFQDRIAQFAAVRTNLDLEQIEDPLLLYCKPADDYLPNPEACLVTGITPQHCQKEGICEYDFARRINSAMLHPGTTVAGYNSIRFDDEFIRNLLYRNLFDPFLREYTKGNSRWDIINLARASRDLRRKEISWPNREDGSPNFTLESIASVNKIQQDRSHDALSDVYATISLARLLKEKHGDLYSWSFSMRNKESLRRLFDLNSQPILVYSAAELTRKEGCTSLICPITVPGNESGQGRNTILCVDLRYNPEMLFDLSVDELRARIFLPSKFEDRQIQRYPVYSIKINQAPFVAPLEFLSSAHGDNIAESLGMSLKDCMHNRDLLLGQDAFRNKLHEIFSSPIVSMLPDDPDYQIYKSFVSNTDKNLLEDIHEILDTILLSDMVASSELLRKILSHARQMPFEEKDRISKLINRLIGRNFAEYLKGRVAKNWQNFCQNRLLFPLIDSAMDTKSFPKRIKELQGTSNVSEKLILKELLSYFEDLKDRIFSD